MRASALFLAFSLLVAGGCSTDSRVPWTGNGHIQPWAENRSYWQYLERPILLLGATDNDNLFQSENMVSHLDSLKVAGGNYIRNTMSDRDPGDLRAYYRNTEGKYDLNRWNDEYWNRFESLLEAAWEREIIVQIEVWDRFDHSRDPWKGDPFNPANNINYSIEETGLDSIYPLHPGRNAQPFFYTVPQLDNNKVLLAYQQLFVDKMLSISLKYDNVLYCIDNETSGDNEWAAYWAQYLKSGCGSRDIYITEMWDDWDVKSETHKRTLDQPDLYGFVDISQNSQIPGRDNWQNAQYVMDYIKEHRRPVNSTKIYGSDRGQWLDRGITTEHAVNTFFRNIIGGFASSRFHRPPSGLGLSDTSSACLRTIRMIEKTVRLWEIEPAMHLLNGDFSTEVYIAAKEGEYYVIFFTGHEKVNLDFKKFTDSYILQWINAVYGEWENSAVIAGGQVVEIDGKKNFIAVISKQ